MFRVSKSPTLDLRPGPDGWSLPQPLPTPTPETDEARERATERARRAHRMLKRKR